MSLIVFIMTALAGLIFGLFLYVKPKEAIEFQKRFYECINWRIEPVSYEKEVRNTRLMGGFLIGCVIIAIVYYGICR